MGGDARADRGDAAPLLSVTADAGAPDGLMAGVMLRASPRWRFHVGAGHNTMSLGVRAGVRTDALTGPVSPFAALEAGYYGAGAAQGWARSIAESAGLDRAELDRVGYRFANGHLGLRFGDHRATLFLQGGVSHIRSHVSVLEVRETTAPMSPTIEIRAQTVLSGWVPSGRFGFATSF